MSFHHLPRQILFHGREWPSVVINDIIQIQKKKLLENPFKSEMSEKTVPNHLNKENTNISTQRKCVCVSARNFSIT